MGDPLDQHWKALRKNKSNPDHLNHGHLLDGEASKKANRDVFRTPALKIVKVSMGVVKSKESPDGESMVFLHFEGVTRKLGLNSTAMSTMESLTGRGAPSQWVGTTIQLYVDPQAQYPAGKKGPAIRIRPTLPKGKPAETSLPEVQPADLERLESEKQERLSSNDREPGEEG